MPIKGHSAAPGKDFSAFLTGGDLGSKEREHCRDAQRGGVRRARTMLEIGTTLAPVRTTAGLCHNRMADIAKIINGCQRVCMTSYFGPWKRSRRNRAPISEDS